MNRRQERTFRWQGDRWRPATARLIERHLQRHRDRLAEMLSIDLSEQEARGVPRPFPKADERTAGARYVEWRQMGNAGVEVVPRIDLAIEELTAALRRCWALNKDINRAASSAQVRHTLESLLADASSIEERWPVCDPETRGMIEEFYPGGWMALESGANRALLVDAVTEALAALPPVKPGRPKGTPDHASRYLGPALAEIYASYALKPATRRNRRAANTFHGPLQSEVYGPFKSFVDLVYSVIPLRLRRTSDGAIKSTDKIVRDGIEHLRPPTRRVRKSSPTIKNHKRTTPQ